MTTDDLLIIETVCRQYGFEFYFEEIQGKYFAKGKDYPCEFYWDSTETVAAFFEELKSFFLELGYHHGSGC